MELDALYRAAVETSPDGIWVLDTEGRTIYANPQIARIHGVEESALADLRLFDVLDAEGQEQLRAHLADVRRGRTHEAEVEVQWVRADGALLWMLCHETPLVDAEGRTTGVLHRYTDFTDRRQLIESLRASEDALEDQISQNTLMQAVASAANEARSLRDVLRHCRSLVLLHDDWERARAFVPVADAVGSADGSASGSVTLEPFYANEGDEAEDAGDPQAPLDLALAQRCADSGRLVWDERRLSIAFPVSLEERVHAVIVITSAPPLWRFELIENMVSRVAEQLARVVERERYQEALAAARDAAMEASRQKSEFLATMSHEIRTPLNGVIGLNDLLMRTELTGEQQRLVSGVQVASRTLLDLLNDILDFSKIEAGHLELEQVAFAPRPLLANATGLLAEAARDKGLDLSVTVDAAVPEAVLGDPTRLAQVVTNLVSNAVKFTETGRVEVHATAEPLATGTRLRVAVTDTGVGVAPEKLVGLFDPFTQADSSTTRVYGGTGLGLAISREIVEAMGGTLEHQPRSGGGSVFAFTAELGEATGAAVRVEPAVPTSAPVLETGHRGHVLVVEDNPVNQMVSTGLLQALGYTCETADDGRAAIAAVAEGRFDAVLMDVQMPHMDGYTATRHIRAAEAGPRRPIIAMTAAAVEGERERCLEAGMDDFLTKPVDAARLAATLARWLAPAEPVAASVAPEPVAEPAAEPAPPPPLALDTQRLDELREIDLPGESSYVARAIDNFLAQTETDLTTLRAALASGEAAAMRQAAHKFAGASLNLGLQRIGAAARELERAVVAGDDAAWPALLLDLEALVASDLDGLRDYRAAGFAAV